MSTEEPQVPAPAAATQSRRQAAMPFIMLTVLIDVISIGLIIPVMPHLVAAFAGGSQAATAHWNLVISTCFAVANFLCSPIIGALSDRFGRRPALLMGFCGLAVSFFVTANATALWMLAVVRLFSGAMMSNITVANAYVADITPPELRAKRFGMLGAVFGVGFILGPVLGGVLGKHDLRLPFEVAGSMALLNLCYGLFVLPESLPRERRARFDWRKANPVGAFLTLGRLPGMGLLIGVFALVSLAQMVLQTTWVLYTAFKFGWDSQASGLSLGAMGLMTALVQGLLLGRLLKRFTTQQLVVLGLLSSSLCLALWGAATAGWMMYAVIFLNVFGFAAGPAFQSLISQSADATMQGRVMGAVASISSLMAVAGPLIGNTLLIAIADLPRGDLRMGAPYYLCAVLQAGALWLAVRHFKRSPPVPPPAPAPAVP